MKNSNSFASLLARPSLLAEIDQERASRSLREFVRQAFAIIEPSTPFVPGWHIDAIIEHLEAITFGHIRNLLINVPPRHNEEPAGIGACGPRGSGFAFHSDDGFLTAAMPRSFSIRDSVKCRRSIESSLVPGALGRPLCPHG